MAFIFQKTGKPSWYIGYSIRGRRLQKSLKTTIRREAEKGLKEFLELERARRLGTLTEEYFLRVTNRGTKQPQARGYLEGWLEETKGTARPNTYSTYRSTINDFLQYLDEKQGVDMDLREVTADTIQAYLAHAKNVGRSAKTVNNRLKIIRIPFKRAHDSGHLDRNPAIMAKPLKLNKENTRHAFTLKEIESVLAKATPPWKWFVICGLYSGQRLGDVVTLRWNQIDTEKRVIRFLQAKTGNRTEIPIVQPLLDAVAELPTPKKTDDFIWPEFAELYRKTGSTSLSKQFHAILVECGLATPWEI
ncbi:MAG: phage integrase SAM-like domain-containing protein [Verrucomicrobia bacterium]|nr:phage integrase SAM-like domain-containing protein [Verrucomicrobiota bacterium]